MEKTGKIRGSQLKFSRSTSETRRNSVCQATCAATGKSRLNPKSPAEDSAANERVAPGSPLVSEHCFADIVDFLPDPTFAINLAGEVIAWNHAMEKHSGWRAEEVLGKGNYVYALPFYNERRPIVIDLVLASHPETEKLYSRIERDGNALLTEVKIPQAGDNRCHLSVKASPLYDQKGEIVGAIETTRDMTPRIRAEEDRILAIAELERERATLKDKNTALKEMLSQIEEEKKRIMKETQSNVDRIATPLLLSLRETCQDSDRNKIDLLTDCLNQITAPFVRSLETKFGTLSPRELQICNMVKSGLSCKEIAATLNTSVNTVMNQRQRIRRKLGLESNKVNLTTFLQGM